MGWVELDWDGLGIFINPTKFYQSNPPWADGKNPNPSQKYSNYLLPLVILKFLVAATPYANYHINTKCQTK